MIYRECQENQFLFLVIMQIGCLITFRHRLNAIRNIQMTMF